ncbi:hypothetical protein HRI_004616400 [Hibiscus trionum]|uniref:RNase H type-1 domain-containing protein n=1 Tax=Hibiscus trionum TaxID=183268 RepID=A0A9W7J786_HIBTR|nr:hypothetical protein HRI_004616400 [Hibiscus trionum]
MAVCTIHHHHVADPFIAEAHASLQTVLFMRDLGFRRVIVEGDSLTVMKKVNGTAHDRSIISPIVQEIKELSKKFESIQFRFTYREANGVAHLLAKLGGDMPSPSYWIEEAPVAVMNLTASEEYRHQRT